MKQDFKDGAQYMETQEHYIKEKRTILKTKDNIIEFWSDKKVLLFWTKQFTPKKRKKTIS